MVYKWVTFGLAAAETWSTWRLLSENQIKRLISINKDRDFYTSVASYDKEGNFISAPQIFADFDGGGAEADVKIFVTKCKELFGYTPNIYSSGRRGFHVVSNEVTSYEKHWRLSRELVKILGTFHSLDLSVYRSRSMFRVNNTFNTKGNDFKRLLTQGKSYSTKFRELERKVIPKIEEIVKKAKLALPSDLEDWRIETPKCIKRLLSEDCLEGNRHNTAVLLARFMRSRKATCEETVTVILRCTWCTLTKKHVQTIVSSVFNASEFSAIFGCKGVELLEDRCYVFCHWRQTK